MPPGRAPYAEVTVGPNRVALLKDGFQAFPAMHAAIAVARRSICLESYMGSPRHSQGVKLEQQFLIRDTDVEQMSQYRLDARLQPQSEAQMRITRKASTGPRNTPAGASPRPWRKRWNDGNCGRIRPFASGARSSATMPWSCSPPCKRASGNDRESN